MSDKEKDTDILVAHIIKGIEDVKGQHTEILDLRAIENTVCDYFIICDGTSNTQVNAIVNSIQKTVSKSSTQNIASTSFSVSNSNQFLRTKQHVYEAVNS